MNTTRLLVIDDHALFRSGLRMVLSTNMPNTEVIEAGSLIEAMNIAPEKIDAIMLDIKLPGLNGLEGIALLKRKWPLTPILMLSSQDEPETVRLALARGATRFISKADTADNILAVLGRVLRGDLSGPTTQGASGGDATNSHHHLTPRQCEVLDRLCQGMSNKLIARQLDLSEHTVRGHVQAILTFLQVSSRSEAAFAARRRGLVG
ncbi:MAG: response regulator transcription factor [Sideroxydans sp.]|nr:response regulator transcription factor [Sideroxydans sp.]